MRSASLALVLVASLVATGPRADDAPGALAVAATAEAAPDAKLDLAPEPRSVAARMVEVRQRVQAAARYPKVAQKRGIEGETLVSFEITSSGRPLEPETERSSGSLLLDRAALHAVEQAAPLPWIYGRVAVPVVFRLRAQD